MIHLLLITVLLTAFVFVLLQKWTAVLLTVIAAALLLLLYGLIRLLTPVRRAPRPVEAPAVPAAPAGVVVPPVIPAATAVVSAPASPPPLDVGRNTVLTARREPSGIVPVVFFSVELFMVLGLTVLLFLK